jgi:hypothetical protein
VPFARALRTNYGSHRKTYIFFSLVAKRLSHPSSFFHSFRAGTVIARSAGTNPNRIAQKGNEEGFS